MSTLFYIGFKYFLIYAIEKQESPEQRELTAGT